MIGQDLNKYGPLKLNLIRIISYFTSLHMPIYSSLQDSNLVAFNAPEYVHNDSSSLVICF